MGHFRSDGVQLKVPRTWRGALSILGNRVTDVTFDIANLL